MIDLDWMQLRELEDLVRSYIVEDIGDCPDELPRLIVSDLLDRLREFLQKG